MAKIVKKVRNEAATTRGKTERRENAVSQGTKARVSYEAAVKRLSENEARQKQLQAEVDKISEDEAKAIILEKIAQNEAEIKQNNTTIRDAETEIKTAEEEKEAAEKFEEFDEMDVDEEDPDITDPNAPQNTIEQTYFDAMLQKFSQGLRITESNGIVDLTQETLLRPTQRVFCHKGEFGKPQFVIVVDMEIPDC
jgi:hypothetical protein